MIKLHVLSVWKWIYTVITEFAFFFYSMHIPNNKLPKKLQEPSGDFISGGDTSVFSEPFAVSFLCDLPIYITSLCYQIKKILSPSNLSRYKQYSYNYSIWRI